MTGTLTLNHLTKRLRAVINRMRPQRPHNLSLLVITDRRKNPHTGGARQLNSVHAHAPGTAMHQERSLLIFRRVILRGIKAHSTQKHQIRVHRRGDLRDARCLNHAHTLGNGQGMAHIYRRILGVTAASKKRHDALAHQSGINALTHSLYHTRDLKTVYGACPRRRRIMPTPLQGIRPVQPGGLHPHQDLPGCRGRNRNLRER